MLIVCFDPKDRVFLVLECLHMVEAKLMFNTTYLNNFDQGHFFSELLALRNILFRSSSLEVIINLFITSTNE